MINTNDILKLKRQLFPTGRAWKIPTDGDFEKMLLALSEQEVVAFNAGLNILNSVIPDNDDFTEADASAWESALSIAYTSENTLADRKLAIYRKMAFPSNVRGRQHKNYLEYQLRQAGFNVTIYEYDDIKDKIKAISHAQGVHHSYNSRHGSLVLPNFTGMVINKIEQEDEPAITLTFEVLKNCIWITGADFSFLPVLNSRNAEFRQIIMHMKPAATIAILRIAPTAVAWILDTGYWNNSGYWFNTSTWKN